MYNKNRNCVFSINPRVFRIKETDALSDQLWGSITNFFSVSALGGGGWGGWVAWGGG